MTVDQSQILLDLSKLATDRGWTNVLATVDAVRAAKPTTILVAMPKGVDPTPFQRWIDRIVPSSEVSTSSLEGLSQDPLPAIVAGRVVVLLECGSLLEADAVAALSVAVLSRPEKSYAVVFGSAERITDADELELIERGARRLLDRDYGIANSASLIEERAFLWSNSPPPAFLSKRLAADCDALASWLTDVPADSPALARDRLLYAINQADESTVTREFSRRDAEVREQRIKHVRESLSELRRRLIRRLDAESGLIQRQLSASLQTLELDLLRGLRPYLEQRIGALVPRADAEFLRNLVVDYLREGTRAWQARTLPTVTSQSLDTVSDTRVLLQGIDWQLVNLVMAGKNGKRNYPDALVSQLVAEASITLPDDDMAEGVDTFELNRQAVGLADAVRVAFAGSAVVATTWYLTGAQAIAMVAAGASAVVASGLFNVRLHREQLLTELEPWARLQIKTIVRDAAGKVQELAPRSIEAMRARLDGELKDVERALDAALADARQRPGDAPSTDRDSIEALRRAALGQDWPIASVTSDESR